ncbi:MAG TPA: type II secretion system protein [Candidatus Saccharimonadales bacterium]|nr:type II secretion system protein [Candidatus Saccharimonadales bacterium]
MQFKRTKKQSGFTLIELLVVIILSTFFSILILTFTFEYWRYAYLLQADLDTLTTRLNAGDILREEIGTSSGMIIQNSITDTHTLVADPSIASGYYWLPNHAIPGTTAIGASGSYKPLIYFERYSFDSSGSYIMNGSQPYEDEYVLYLNGTTKSLMQRTLVNPSATGDRLKTSCPPAQATASCPADKTIATDIASVATRYFSRTGNVIDYTSITDPDTGAYIGPDFPVVEVLELTLNLTKKPTFQKTNATSNSTIIRIALRNS